MDAHEKAFDFAQELCKQIITLSTALVGLTITFRKDIIGSESVVCPWLAYGSWYALLGSVFCGIWMLMALAGVLEPLQRKDQTAHNQPAATVPSIRAFNIVVPSILQIVAFVVGLLLLVAFGQLNYR